MNYVKFIVKISSNFDKNLLNNFSYESFDSPKMKMI